MKLGCYIWRWPFIWKARCKGRLTMFLSADVHLKNQVFSQSTWSREGHPCFYFILVTLLKFIVIRVTPENHLTPSAGTKHSCSVQLLTNTRWQHHISFDLNSLHWLPVCFRIDLKILLITFKALNGSVPSYIAELRLSYEPERSLRSSDPQAGLCWLFLSPSSKLKVTGFCSRGLLESETPCLRIWDLQNQ